MAVSDKINQTAADIAAQIHSLKDKLKTADFGKRAGLREEISVLEHSVFPEAVEREKQVEAQARADELARIELQLVELEQERQPHAARRMALTVEIDRLIGHISARDAAKARQLADVLRDVAVEWEGEAAIVHKTMQLASRREELNKIR